MDANYTSTIRGPVCNMCAAVVANKGVHTDYHNTVIQAFKERDKAFRALFNILVDAEIIRSPKMDVK